MQAEAMYDRESSAVINRNWLCRTSAISANAGVLVPSLRFAPRARLCYLVCTGLNWQEQIEAQEAFLCMDFGKQNSGVVSTTADFCKTNPCSFANSTS